MNPVWHFLGELDGFELSAFWIAFGTGVMLSGFFLDYIMQRQGFGPIYNALFVLGGIFAGLYVRFNYLELHDVRFQDPFLTVGAILGAIALLLVTSAFVRNRTS